MVPPAIVALALLAILAHGLIARRSIAARVAARFGRERRAAVAGWAAGTMVAYALPALAALALIGRWQALWTLPPEFRRFADAAGVPRPLPGETGQIGSNLLIGLAIGTAILFVARSYGRLSARLLYRSPATARGWREAPAAALLALSAGVGEELFFRLALPLAVALATGSALAGVAVATVGFGLAHRHQGTVGLVLTTLVGAGLAWLYLWTGALWFAVLVHTTVDVHALVVRPWIGGWPGPDRAAGR